MIRFSVGALAIAMTVATGLAQDNKSTIVDIAAKSDQFKTLVAAVKAAGLASTLAGDGPFTVFAPTDAAFKKLGKGTLQDLLKPENKGKLADILRYHVVAGKVPATKVAGMKGAKTVQGAEVAIATKEGKVRIGEATVVKADIMASNGVIHVIDTVLLPPQATIVDVAKQAGSFGTLLKAAVAAGLAETLTKEGPFTVFAPTDEAFAKLGNDTIASLLKPQNKAKLASILKHHVVAGKVMSAQAVKLSEAKAIDGKMLPLKYDGKTLQIGAAKVIKADVAASNGVIHVIDTVLLPKE